LAGTKKYTGETEMTLNKAAGTDLEAVMSIIRDCVADMERRGIFQWNQYYPDETIIKTDIEKGTGLIYKSGGEPAAYLSLDGEQPPEYGGLAWQTRGERVLVVHRLCVRPCFQGRGVASGILQYVEDYAAGQCYDCIRLDAYSCNAAALRLYGGSGYRRVGQVYFPHREQPFYCFEKAVSKAF
jgi:ribosomal protein S18 acetylase RimI-like enzyme